MEIKKRIRAGLADLARPVSIAPLIIFRISFGLLMFVSLLRFEWRGWVDSVYVTPKFHFTYMGFEWVRQAGATGMHLLFLLVAVAALFVALGLFYRVAIVVFFIGFTYIELIDVTTYLNHYYFISLVAFLMIWLPAGSDYSLDIRLHPKRRRQTTSAWTINILRCQIAIVYIFAGLAKLNADWLLHAEPMRTWLPAKTHLPLIGPLLYKEWVAYFFSWFGAAYDLFIVFFLLYRKTRVVAYGFVLIFHIATAIFFPGIGLFPYVMIVSSLIFFPGRAITAATNDKPIKTPGLALAVYVVIQLLIPARFLLYPGGLFWHEEGYRFSWRVMLMEKSGAAYFTIRDSTGSRSYVVDNKDFLTPLQEKMMSTQPDMILKYAHHLADEYARKGVPKPKVYGEVYVALNGRRSRLFVDSAVDLAAQPLSWRHYRWVLPYEQSK